MILIQRQYAMIDCSGFAGTAVRESRNEFKDNTHD